MKPTSNLTVDFLGRFKKTESITAPVTHPTNFTPAATFSPEIKRPYIITDNKDNFLPQDCTLAVINWRDQHSNFSGRVFLPCLGYIGRSLTIATNVEVRLMTAHPDKNDEMFCTLRQNEAIILYDVGDTWASCTGSSVGTMEVGEEVEVEVGEEVEVEIGEEVVEVEIGEEVVEVEAAVISEEFWVGEEVDDTNPNYPFSFNT